jgi:hypothetical protein
VIQRVESIPQSKRYATLFSRDHWCRAPALLMALAAGLSGYLPHAELWGSESAPLATDTNTAQWVLAQRQGRCRALNHHLGRLAQAQDRDEAEVALKSLSLLIGEMMNAYPMPAAYVQDTQALPEIDTPEGRQALLEARESLRHTLREVRPLEAAEAAAQVADQCQACHARFMREGGAGITLPGQRSPGT